MYSSVIATFSHSILVCSSVFLKVCASSHNWLCKLILSTFVVLVLHLFSHVHSICLEIRSDIKVFVSLSQTFEQRKSRSHRAWTGSQYVVELVIYSIVFFITNNCVFCQIV